MATLQTTLSESQDRITQLEFQLDQALEENSALRQSAEKVWNLLLILEISKNLYFIMPSTTNSSAWLNGLARASHVIHFYSICCARYDALYTLLALISARGAHVYRHLDLHTIFVLISTHALIKGRKAIFRLWISNWKPYQTQSFQIGKPNVHKAFRVF